MRVSIERAVVCWVMLVVVPVSLLGQNPAAILHTQGGVWVNGYEAKDSGVVFSGDVLETKTGFSAELTVEGASIVLGQETVAKFQGDWLELDHGTASVATSRSFKVVVHCVSVVPVVNDNTSYEVTDVNGTVHVAARKLNVNVSVSGRRRAVTEATGPQTGSDGGSVREGEERNYSESELCGVTKPTGAGSGMNPKWIALGAAGAGLLIWMVAHGGGSHPPVSSSQP
jgi:hypothetical protein